MTSYSMTNEFANNTNDPLGLYLRLRLLVTSVVGHWSLGVVMLDLRKCVRIR